MKKNRRGYVLISVLVIMLVMLGIAYFLTDTLFSEAAITRNQRSATSAFHLAEAGVQEAIWRIQNDTTARETFLNTTNGQTNFSHDPALLTGGSYEVSIQNTAKAAATITATGFYQMGLKTAQRKIKVSVTKADTPPPYDYDGAVFTGGSTGEEDITLNFINLQVTGTHLVDHDNDPATPEVAQPWGSLISNRDIWYTLSTLNIAKDIIAKRNIRNLFSSVTVGGQIKANDPGTYTMPVIDVSSDNANSYKSKAIAQNQYFTAKAFDDLIHAQHNLTFSGVVYVAGGINIKAKTFSEPPPTVTVNGVLAAEGAIDVGAPMRKGTLTVNHVEGQPSGVITLSKFTAWAYSVININGLVYVGDRFGVDPWFNLDNSTKDIVIKGGVLCRRFDANGVRTIKIDFNQDYINETLQTNPPATPIIETQHWEEEY